MATPKIIHDNRFDDAAPVSSGDAAGYPMANMLDWRPYTSWIPSALPATVTVDCSIPKPADNALLWGHGLQSALAGITVHASTDNFATSDVLIASSNMLAAPQDFTNAAWSKTSGVTVSANTTLAPDGTYTADTINLPGTGSYQGVANSTPYLNALTGYGALAYTFSIWLAGSGTIHIDGDTCTLPSGPLQVTLTPTLTRYTIQLQPQSGGSASWQARILSYPGDTATAVIAWGAQLEYATTASNYQGANNAPMLINFTSASYRYWRLKVVQLYGATIPSINVFALGAALSFPYQMDLGNSFDPTARTVVAQDNRSDSGYPLGRVTYFEKYEVTLYWTMLPWSFIRNTFLPAWTAHLRDRPWVFAWDTDTYPADLKLLSIKSQLQTPINAGPYSDMQFDVVGLSTV